MHHLYAKILTPLWTPEMGHRLSIARQDMLVDQSEMADRLGIGQPSVSKLENGRVRVTEIPFSVLSDALGKYLKYVLLGTNRSDYSEAHIQATYWKTRLNRVKTPEEIARAVRKEVGKCK